MSAVETRLEREAKQLAIETGRRPDAGWRRRRRAAALVEDGVPLVVLVDSMMARPDFWASDAARNLCANARHYAVALLFVEPPPAPRPAEAWPVELRAWVDVAATPADAPVELSGPHLFHFNPIQPHPPSQGAAAGLADWTVLRRGGPVSSTAPAQPNTGPSQPALALPPQRDPPARPTGRPAAAVARAAR